MNITFKDYIQNPSGGRTMMVGEKNIAQELYTDKYNKMMMRSAGAIEYTLYKKKDERYVIYIKMPSEGTKDLYYDVVVEFFTKDVVPKSTNSLDGYFIRFFSNDPNFTFTYAYVFNQRELIIPELKKKISKEALKTNPAKSNPNLVVGYVKSLYFAYLFIDSHGLFNKLNWLNAINNQGLMKADLENKCMESDRKLTQAQKLKKLNKANQKGSIHIGDVDDQHELEYKTKAYVTMKNQQNKTKKVDGHRKKMVKKVGYVKKIKRG